MGQAGAMTEDAAKDRWADEKYIVLETYRKNGEGVRTAVWFVEDNGTLFVRTGTKTGKMKRLRNNGKIRLAASNGRGTPKGHWLEARYNILERDEWQSIINRMREKYGLQWKMISLLHKLQGSPNYTFLALKPVE